jgi:hypothetical protein
VYSGQHVPQQDTIRSGLFAALYAGLSRMTSLEMLFTEVRRPASAQRKRIPH